MLQSKMLIEIPILKLLEGFKNKTKNTENVIKRILFMRKFQKSLIFHVTFASISAFCVTYHAHVTHDNTCLFAILCHVSRKSHDDNYPKIATSDHSHTSVRVPPPIYSIKFCHRKIDPKFCCIVTRALKWRFLEPSF